MSKQDCSKKSSLSPRSWSILTWKSTTATWKPQVSLASQRLLIWSFKSFNIHLQTQESIEILTKLVSLMSDSSTCWLMSHRELSRKEWSLLPQSVVCLTQKQSAGLIMVYQRSSMPTISLRVMTNVTSSNSLTKATQFKGVSIRSALRMRSSLKWLSIARRTISSLTTLTAKILL